MYGALPKTRPDVCEGNAEPTKPLDVPKLPPLAHAAAVVTLAETLYSSVLSVKVVGLERGKVKLSMKQASA